MLDRSQHDYAFATWSSMLMVMAGGRRGSSTVLVYTAVDEPATSGGHLRLPVPPVRDARHSLRLSPRPKHLANDGGRNGELWSIWVGYFVTYGMGIFVTRTMQRPPHRGVAWSGRQSRYLVELLPYPFVSLVAGLAFFVMGSNYWGRCYMFGIAFWVMAALMPLKLSLAPLEFGAVWTVSSSPGSATICG